MQIEISDPTGKPLSTLVRFENLIYESVIPGGYSVATFTERRPINRSYADLQKWNRVKITEGNVVVWWGWMDRPKAKIRPKLFEITCLGFSSILGETARFDAYAPRPCSTFITEVLLVDSNVQLQAGDIQDGDYDLPEAVPTDGFKFYGDMLTEYMAVNDHWAWACWGPYIDWKQCGVGDADYIVNLADCDTGDLSPGGPVTCNWVHYKWNNGTAQVADVYNQGAIDAWGGRVVMQLLDMPGVCTDATALQRATVLLSQQSLLRMQAGFTTKRLLDVKTLRPVDLTKVKARENVMVADMLTSEVNYNISTQVNELCTFMMRGVKYNRKPRTIEVTPSEFRSHLDVLWARINAKSSAAGAAGATGAPGTQMVWKGAWS